MLKFSCQQKIWFILSCVLLVGFIAFTLVVAWVDTTEVGLSHFNHFVWEQCGQNVVWERLTDWLGYGLILALCGLLGWQIWQWVTRKHLRDVDKNLLLCDVMCGALVVIYLFFEIVVVNYRPVLDHGVAKASYPSSHAMLFCTVLPLLIWQIWHYCKSQPWRIVGTVLLVIILIVGVVGRLLSGVHWATDILGGVLMGACLNCFYWAFMVK